MELENSIIEIGGIRSPILFWDALQSSNEVVEAQNAILKSAGEHLQNQAKERGGYLWLGEGHTSQLNK